MTNKKSFITLKRVAQSGVRCPAATWWRADSASIEIQTEM